MDIKDVNKRLEELKVEDFIWIIYIFIIIISLYSNTFERKYFLYNDIGCREKYRKITIFIFTILIIVYAYFFIDSIDDIKNLNSFDSKKKRDLTKLSMIGSLLILISGFIFLYIIVNDSDIEVEVAFN